jgi:RNA polymerase sigma-32 factor
MGQEAAQQRRADVQVALAGCERGQADARQRRQDQLRAAGDLGRVGRQQRRVGARARAGDRQQQIAGVERKNAIRLGAGSVQLSCSPGKTAQRMGRSPTRLVLAKDVRRVRDDDLLSPRRRRRGRALGRGGRLLGGRGRRWPRRRRRLRPMACRDRQTERDAGEGHSPEGRAKSMSNLWGGAGEHAGILSARDGRRRRIPRSPMKTTSTSLSTSKARPSSSSPSEATPEDDRAEEGEAADVAGEVPAADELDPEEAQVPDAVLEPEVTRGAPKSPTGLAAPIRDPVGRFLSEARRYPRLSESEERELGVAVRQRGDMDAARKLVVHNLRLVVAIAYQYRRAWTNILDLFQEGSVGLMEAVKRWEPTLGPRFGSYAAYWIRAFVLKFLLTNSRLIHVGNTRAGRKLFFRLEKERQKLLAAGFEPTPKLLAAKLDVDEKELDQVSQHLDSREVSFEPRAGAPEDSYPLSERIAAEQETPEERAVEAEMVGAVAQFVDGFRERLTDERERAVWIEHLAAEEPVSLGVLGERFGVTKQRMGQIADKLKKRFREEIVRDLGEGIQTDWLRERD